jgi:peptidoglycan/xylan/chitin deacetylase (PgdA/CDA1 family)
VSDVGEIGFIPILLYHSVSTSPSSWIDWLTVSPTTFARHLDLIGDSGRQAVTVSQLRDGLNGLVPLPSRPVVITFDDGYADTLAAAAPAMAARALAGTVYITTGFLEHRSPGGDRMLSSSGLLALAALGHEIGAHSVTHPELDTLGGRGVRREVTECRHQLQDLLGAPIRSFAYPHGYSNALVRRLVFDAGYESACSVRNSLSVASDPGYAICRLMINSGTSDAQLRQWLSGAPGRPPRPPEALVVKAWRGVRRGRALARRAGFVLARPVAARSEAARPVAARSEAEGSATRRRRGKIR